MSDVEYELKTIDGYTSVLVPVEKAPEPEKPKSKKKATDNADQPEGAM